MRALPGFGRVSEARVLAAIRGRHEPRACCSSQIARGIGASLAAHLARDARRAARRGLRPDAALDGGRGSRRGRGRDRARPTRSASACARIRCVERIAPVDDELAVAPLASGVRCELHDRPPSASARRWSGRPARPAHVAASRRSPRRAALALDAIAARGRAVALRARSACRGSRPRSATAPTRSRPRSRATPSPTWSPLADITGAVHCHTDLQRRQEQRSRRWRAPPQQRGLGCITITDHSPTAQLRRRLSTSTGSRAVARDRRPCSRASASGSCAAPSPTSSPTAASTIPTRCSRSSTSSSPASTTAIKLDEDGMTRRLVAAMRQPVFKIWGHALGRLVLRREPVAVPLRRGARRDRRVAGGDRDQRRSAPPRSRSGARPPAPTRAAIRFVLSTDAHSTRQLDHLRGRGRDGAARARPRRGEV